MEYRLNDAQLQSLIDVLAKEPDTNWWTANTLVAISLIILAFVEFWKERQRSDSSLILDSASKYEDLFSDLVRCNELIREHASLSELLSVKNFTEQGFEVVKDHNVEDIDWDSVRKVKTFYKSRMSLHSMKTGFFQLGYFSDRALAKSMDQYGSFTLDGVRLLDVHRFYQVRLADYKNGVTDNTSLEKMFKEDFRWYDELKKFMKNYNTTFKRD